MRKPSSPTSIHVLQRLFDSFRSGRKLSGRGILETCFGPLEMKVLDALWRRGDAASVRTLQDDFADMPYTTLMTTLDRLFKKGALGRERRGRAYVYRSRCTRADLESRLARDAFDLLFTGRMRGPRARPVLSGLVEAVGAEDALLLDELERLVWEKRSERNRTRSPEGSTE